MATDQTFVDYQTPIPADWLNNVNNHVNSLDTYEHAASKISNTLTGSVPEGDVQGALANLDGRVTTANDTANTANTTANNAMPKAGGNFTGPANANKGADLASAATVNIGAATGEYLNITGTTTITAFDTVQAGTERTVRFTGALTLTHNATTLILPTAANITTTAGDVAIFRSEGSGNWRCVSYMRADGSSLTSRGMVRLNTANGYGSTNTKIHRFTNTVTNQGADITYTDSATLGASFTINNSGVYSISFSCSLSGSGLTTGLSLDTTTPTTNIFSCAVGEILTCETNGVANGVISSTWIGYLPATSVVRPHGDGSAIGESVNAVQFTISRVS